MRIDSPHDGVKGAVGATFRGQGIMAGISTLASRLVRGVLQTDTRQFQKYLVGFLIALGIALRLVQFMADRALCYDEAALAVNIVQRTHAELLQPLDFDQGAPLGFLAIQKTVSQWLGNSDRALRLVPFLCGIASVILCYGAARCFAAPWPATVFLALFVLSRPLIYYSCEFKQYSSDVLITLLLLACAGLALDAAENNKRHEKKRLALWAVAGVLAVWLSHPSVFVLAGSGAVLLIRAGIRREWSRLLGCLAVALAWLVSFGAVFVVTLGQLADNDFLTSFWQGRFMPLPPTSMTELLWFVQTLFTTLESPVGLQARDISLAGIGVLALLLGAYCLGRQSVWLLGLLAAPICFTLLASGLRCYPFGDRLLLFLAPIALLLVAIGTEQVWSRTAKSFPLLAIGFLTLVFLAPVLGSAGKLVQPGRGNNIKPLLEYLGPRRQENDILYVYTSTWPAYLFYATHYGLPGQSKVIRGTSGGSRWEEYLADLDRLRGQCRVWLLMTQHQKVDKLFRAYLVRHGKRLEAMEHEGAALYLYDLSVQARSGSD